MEKIDVIVVIPCLNERAHIRKSINALLNQKQGVLKGRIVVVDNGSTDGTMEIIKGFGDSIKLFSLPGVGISELRNHGAQTAESRWIAFVDADVEVLPSWLDAVERRIQILGQDSEGAANTIFGSVYEIPQDSTWVEKTWYGQLDARDKFTEPRYLNAGNMIIHRSLFNRIGGFDKAYVTGEDVKLCADARAKGGKILQDRRISAVHHGYSKTLCAFFRREKWHGIGMEGSLLRPWKSKPLMLASYYLISLVFFAITCMFWQRDRFIILALFFLTITVPLIPLVAKRGGKTLGGKLRLILLYGVYGWARSVSLFEILLHRSLKRARDLLSFKKG